MPHFFIERPVFAWVIAVLISLGGLIAIHLLGITKIGKQLTVAAAQIEHTAARVDPTGDVRQIGAQCGQ